MYLLQTLTLLEKSRDEVLQIQINAKRVYNKYKTVYGVYKKPNGFLYSFAFSFLYCAVLIIVSGKEVETV